MSTYAMRLLTSLVLLVSIDVAFVMEGQGAVHVSAAPAYSGLFTYATAGQIYVVRPDGSGKTKIANGVSPIFSRDGARVAFVVQTDTPPKAAFVRSIGLTNGDVRDECTLYTNELSGAVESLIGWSSSGRFIAVNSTQNGPGAVALCDTVQHTYGQNLKYAQGMVSAIFDWSSDGAMTLWQASMYYGNGEELYYGDPDTLGAGATQLTRGQNRSAGYYSSARISPDGTTVAVAGDKLFFLTVPGQASQYGGRVIDTGGLSRRLSWAPDGTAIAATTDFGLEIVDLTTERVTPLAVDAVSGEWSPALSAPSAVALDGSQFAPFAYGWGHHGSGFTVDLQGNATLSFRVYKWCSDDPTPPCDSFSGNEIISGGNASFRFTQVTGQTASGTITQSTDPMTFRVGGPIFLTLQQYDTATLTHDMNALTYCGPDFLKAPQGFRDQFPCGA